MPLLSDSVYSHRYNNIITCGIAGSEYIFYAKPQLQHSLHVLQYLTIQEAFVAQDHPGWASESLAPVHEPVTRVVKHDCTSRLCSSGVAI